MLSQQALLIVLSDGEWHSGEDLGAHFNVSRAAIWKQLKQLQTAGIALESERGKGYCLSSPMSLLDQASINAGLNPQIQTLVSNLDIEFSIPSTNSAAKQRIEQGGIDANYSGHVIFAEQQTAGRGRRGRTWVSPLGRNIYMSTIWRFSAGASALSGLSLAVGVAIVKALESLGYKGIGLKWPNDLLWQGKKLGGILLEISGDAAGPCHVVVGIGLNVSMPDQQAANDIDQPWVDLVSLNNQPVDKNAIAAALLNQLMPMLATFEASGFEPLLQDWLDRDAYLGSDIVLTMGADKLQGQQVGVKADGSLCIETVDGLRTFNGGEVSLRAVQAEG